MVNMDNDVTVGKVETAWNVSERLTKKKTYSGSHEKVKERTHI
jgi:hypothetical protein